LFLNLPLSFFLVFTFFSFSLSHTFISSVYTSSLKFFSYLHALLLIPTTISFLTLIRGDTHNFRDWCCHLYSGCSRAVQR
jgi:hypothetical protein